jgi:hypothetical protein
MNLRFLKHAARKLPEKPANEWVLIPYYWMGKGSKYLELSHVGNKPVLEKGVEVGLGRKDFVWKDWRKT